MRTKTSQDSPAPTRVTPKERDGGLAGLAFRRGRRFVLLSLLVVAALGAWSFWRWGVGLRSLQLLAAVFALEGFAVSLALLWASGESRGKAGGVGMEQERVSGRAEVPPPRVTSAAQVAGNQVSFGTCSVLGHRKQNEDACGAYTFPLLDSEATLLVVCDGVGGEASGDRASKEAVKLYSKLIPEIVALGEAVINHDAFSGVVRGHFKEMASAFDELARREELTGLTTTVVAAFAYKDFLAYWWAGDSRAYLMRKNRLRLLSKDHSVPVERHNVDPLDVANHEEKSTLTRALQPNVTLLPDVEYGTLEKGDVLVLCSDGVWESCTHGELQGILNYFLIADFPLSLVCQNVLNVLSLNTSDNSTIAIHRQNGPAPSHTLLHPGVLLTRGLREEYLAWLYETNGVTPPEHLEHLVRPHASSPETATEAYAGRQASPRRQPAEGSVGREGEGPRLCLHCSKVVAGDAACCETPDLHAGYYLLSTDAAGRVSYYKVSNPKATILGRSADSGSIAIDDPSVAPRHLKIEVENDGGVLFKDLDSDNGTFLSISAHRALLPDLDRTVFQLGASRVQLLHTSLLEEASEPGQPA